MKKYTPVVLFVYNRPRHTQLTLEALKANILAPESELIVYSDGQKNPEDKVQVDKVRQILDTLTGFKNVVRIDQLQNKGLAASIIEGVSEVIAKYDRVIVLEDDLITSPHFLDYMNNGLDAYKNTSNIFSISGYTPPITIPKDYREHVYWVPRCASWGWGTWKDRWVKVDWNVSDFSNFIQDLKAQKKFNSGGNDMTEMLKNQISGKLDSWAIRWCFSHYKHQAGCAYPTKSKVINIGIDGSGTHHTTSSKKYDVQIDLAPPEVFPAILIQNHQLCRQFKSFYDISQWLYFKQMLLRILKNR